MFTRKFWDIITLFEDRPADSDAEEGDDGNAEQHCRKQQWQGIGYFYNVLNVSYEQHVYIQVSSFTPGPDLSVARAISIGSS